jgi:hypothetical protein
MDSAGLASALSGGNTDMLLYALRARIHIIIVKQKEPFCKELFLCHPILARSASRISVCHHYSKLENFVKGRLLNF